MADVIRLDIDQQYLKQLVKGESKGLEGLFKKYYTFLVRFSLQIVKKEEAAEDITQEVFIKLWDKRDTLEGVSNIKAYLFQATKNSSLNWINAKKNQHQSIDVVSINPQDNYNAEDYLAFEETQQKINRALSLIPEKCREVFLLSRSEGKSYKEISDALGISIKTVENQMGKALKILRDELGITLFILYILQGL